MTALWMLLAALATYRLTMLVVYDEVTAPPREWVKTRVSGHGLRSTVGAIRCVCGASRRWARVDVAHAETHVAVERHQLGGWRGGVLTLLGCPWCVSVWAGAAVVTAGYLADGALWWEVPALILSASAATGLLARAAHP